MNVLVTGSSGFIGSYLVEALRTRGHHVVGLDREPPGWSRPDRFVQGDLRDRDVCSEAVDRVDSIFHLAAAKDDWGISEREYRRDNVDASQSIVSVGLEEGVQDWFFYSTVGVLGSSREPLDENAPWAPETPYATTKAEAEDLFRELGRHPAVDRVIILRPSAVYGPEEPTTTNLYRLIEAIRRRRFVMIGDGEQLKTTSHIGNLLPASLFLWERCGSGTHVFHYVDEPVLTTRELVGRLGTLLRRQPLRFRLPAAVAKPAASVLDVLASLSGVDIPITAARIEKFCTSTNFSSARIRRLGFEPPVGHQEALEATVRWHLERKETYARSYCYSVLSS